MRIFKYQLPRVSEQSIIISLPKGSILQTAQVQYNQPVLYALVNNEEKEYVHFPMRVYETGQKIAEVNQVLLGTCIMDGGATVLHFYKEV